MSVIMTRRKPTYDQINQQMRGKLPAFLLSQRDDNQRTWVDIAHELGQRTGLVLEPTTVRRWHYAVTHETANREAQA